MPIVFVHGVGARDEKGFESIREFLQRYIAPAISKAEGPVPIHHGYWGDLASHFAWDGASQPKGPILGQGGTIESIDIRANKLASVSKQLSNLPGGNVSSGPLIAAGPAMATNAQSVRLKDLSTADLSNLCASVLANESASSFSSEKERALAIIAADEVAHDPGTALALALCGDTKSELTALESRIRQRYNEYKAKQSDALAGQGFTQWLDDLTPRLSETLSRVTDTPGYVVSRLAAECRTPLNSFITNFIGDVFCYLNNRGNSEAIGDIPNRILNVLKSAHSDSVQRNNEPIIVLTHSMGGQIVYDLVTHFLPKCAQFKDIKIDFWCATASQVGLFEELKLFIEKEPSCSLKAGKHAPFPPKANLGHWFNVWDFNDFVSYTGKPIFDGIDDESYDSGMFLLQAHGGYLARPSFYQRLATKIESALSV